MEELIKKLKDTGKLEALKSEDGLRTAAKELGYSDADIDKLISEYDIPLDVEALEKVAGGMVLR